MRSSCAGNNVEEASVLCGDSGDDGDLRVVHSPPPPSHASEGERSGEERLIALKIKLVGGEVMVGVCRGTKG